MTLHDAVGLALFGTPRRRLLGALVRTLLGRPLAGLDEVSPPMPEEPVLVWACRVAGEPAPEAAAADLDARVADTLRQSAARQQVVVALGTPDYPAALAEIPDPPPALWLRGAAEMLAWPRMVAVVGARAATPGGLALAAHLAAGLAEAGVVVVSGLARGIDSVAHRAALDRGGASIGVLGSSLDRLYPAEHRELAAALTAQGAVVSEHVPGTPPLPFHFPLRNRIISGLSSAVVVVEASEKSGSLITAMAAAEQGREVMAVPGPVGPGRHRGGHALLRDGATLVEGPEDILTALGWLAEDVTPRGAGPGLEPGLARELGLEPGCADFSGDEVAVATGWPLARVNARLGALEIDGKIQKIGNGRFMPGRTRVLT